MKRFYKTTAAAEAGDGFRVELDGRPIRTPAKEPLNLPTLALAEAIADEWAVQEEEIQPDTMALMRLAATAIDRVSPRREQVIDEIAAYGGSDLVCYRAESPKELAARQEEVWGPLLGWVGRRFDVGLKVTSGLVHVAQDEAALDALRRAVAAHDDMILSALFNATTATGSLVVALALLEGEVDAAAAFEAGEVDASYQIELWGEDHEALDRRERLRRDIENCARFMALCRV